MVGALLTVSHDRDYEFDYNLNMHIDVNVETTAVVFGADM